MQSALWGEVAEKKEKDRGRAIAGWRGGVSGVESHLHSPTKFLYLVSNGMRQNRVRRVSSVAGGSTNSIGATTEVVSGDEASAPVGAHTHTH